MGSTLKIALFWEKNTLHIQGFIFKRALRYLTLKNTPLHFAQTVFASPLRQLEHNDMDTPVKLWGGEEGVEAT